MTDRQTLLARQPPWVQRRALPAGPSRPRCLNPGWPKTPGALVPTPGRTLRGSCRLGAAVRALGDPRKGGGIQGDSNRRGRLLSGEARTWASGGCPGSGLHREATVPSSIRDAVPGAEEPSSQGKPQVRGHQSGRLTGAACPRGRRRLPGGVSGRTQAWPTCPVHTQIMKTGLETAGLGT